MTKRRFASDIVRLMSAVLIVAACTRTVPQTGTMPEHEHDEQELMVRTGPEYIAAARADSVRRPYTQADVDFMTAMIGHHAQALVMSRMAPTHGASSSVRTLAARIINGQQDEIRLMQQWLIDRQKSVPMAHTSGPVHAGHESMHAMAPGMLTNEQLDRCDRIWTVPTDPERPSLNLAQAVILCAYEWSKHVLSEDEGTRELIQPTAEERLPPAPQDELEGLIVHFESLLEAVGYFSPASRAAATRLTLRNMLTKPAWNHLEVRTLRGVLSAIERKRG